MQPETPPRGRDAKRLSPSIRCGLGDRIPRLPQLRCTHVGGVAGHRQAGHAVDIGEHHLVGPARRWAVVLDAGGLVFADTDQLAAE